MHKTRPLGIICNTTTPKLLGIALAVTFLSACTSEQSTSKNNHRAAAPVILQNVDFQSEQVRIEAVGTSRAQHSVTLFSETPGEVNSVLFQAGDRVKAGQVLLTLKDQDEQLAVKLARVQLAEAKRLYQRYLNSGNTSGISPTTIDAARLAQESAEIELQKALFALEKRQIKAPFTGFIGITDIDAGDRITSNEAIATLDDRNALLVTFEVPELFIDRLGIGDPLLLSAWNDQTRPINGKLVDINSRIDPVKRTFVARARVENEQDRLRPGMSFRVKLELKGQVYPAIPQVSVQWGGEGAYVWVADSGKARRATLNIVQRLKQTVLVDGELKPGDQVVVEGVQRMRDGIEIVAWKNNTANSGQQLAVP